MMNRGVLPAALCLNSNDSDNDVYLVGCTKSEVNNRVIFGVSVIKKIEKTVALASSYFDIKPNTSIQRGGGGVGWNRTYPLAFAERLPHHHRGMWMWE